MATSSAAVANKALQHLGVAGVITTLATDTTAVGKAAYRFYADAVRETLSAHPWSCAQKVGTLTLVETIAASNTREWQYKYRLPEDCLNPGRLLWAGVRNPRADQQVPFDTKADTGSTTYGAGTAYAVGDYASESSVWYRCIQAGTGQTPSVSPLYWTASATAQGGPPKFLYTDLVDAELEYTMDLTDTTRFDVDFEAAVAARLAYAIAPSVTVNGSAPVLRQQALELWQYLINKAIAADFNARQRDLPPVSGYQAARGIRAR